jgi:hypothetical protein
MGALTESFAPGESVEAEELAVSVVTVPLVFTIYCFFGWRLGILSFARPEAWVILGGAAMLGAVRAARWWRSVRSCIAQPDGLLCDGVALAWTDLVLVRLARDSPGFFLEIEGRDGARRSVVVARTRALCRRFGVRWAGPRSPW